MEQTITTVLPFEQVALPLHSSRSCNVCPAFPSHVRDRHFLPLPLRSGARIGPRVHSWKYCRRVFSLLPRTPLPVLRCRQKEHFLAFSFYSTYHGSSLFCFGAARLSRCLRCRIYFFFLVFVHIHACFVFSSICSFSSYFFRVSNRLLLVLLLPTLPGMRALKTLLARSTALRSHRRTRGPRRRPPPKRLPGRR